MKPAWKRGAPGRPHRGSHRRLPADRLCIWSVGRKRAVASDANAINTAHAPAPGSSLAMASTKGKLFRFFSGLALKQSEVTAADAVGGFRRLSLRVDLPPFPAGSKVQLLLPSDEVRTYTPIATREGITLLGWMHAGGPGAHWLSTVKQGDRVQFLGPQNSLDLPAGPVVIVGDETSLAVAASYANERPGQVQVILESNDASEIQAAAKSVGLETTVVVPRSDLGTATASITSIATPTAFVALTGCSERVIALRSALRAAGFKNIKTKPYWIPGKTGLD